MAVGFVELIILAIIGLVGLGVLFGLIWWIVSLFDKNRDKPAE
jgi:hypothetical protein